MPNRRPSVNLWGILSGLAGAFQAQPTSSYSATPDIQTVLKEQKENSAFVMLLLNEKEERARARVHSLLRFA